MKNGFFQFRMNKNDRAILEEVARYYGVTASSAVRMLIAKEFKEIKKGKNDEGVKFI